MDTIKGTKIITDQIINILKQIDTEEYCRSLELFNGSSLGQHFRHILDFYNCLLNGFTTGIIDYALRDREANIENDTTAAIQAFLIINQKVEQLNEQQTLQVKADFVGHDGVMQPLVQSSVGRELMYAYDHALHHLAIVKIGIKIALPHICLDKDIGVAPSTLRYKKTINANQ